MKKLFEELKGLSLEEGAKKIRETYETDEQSFKEDGRIDFDFRIKENNYFSYTTTYEEVEDDEDIIHEGGYWAVMVDGEHYTHV